MPIQDPRGTRADSLMAQINIDNVMQVYRIFDQQVLAMQRALQGASALRNIPTCGDDVISVDARSVFQPKIDQILAEHQRHLDEIREARDRLKDAARQYGLLEQDATSSFRGSDLPSQ